MKNDLKYILLTLILLVGTLTAGAVGLAATGVSGEESQQVEDELAVRVDSVMQQEEREDKAFDPKRTIFEHLGDEYGWTIIGKVTIPLPVIVRDNGGEWYFFSSSRLADGKTYKGFHIAGEGAYEGKIVGVDATGDEYRPYDFSITKNAFSVMISGLITMLIVFSLVRFYKRKKFKAPRKGMGGLEMIVEMLYKEVIVSVLGKESKRYAPYLLTLFFFIFVSNMMGLIAVFPGGANVMGNMSITLVLALCTFVVINVSGTKEYWKEIFWPDVPMGLKCPVPLLPVIEIFGVFTKPVALISTLDLCSSRESSRLMPSIKMG